MPRIKVTTKGLDAILGRPHATRVDYFDSATPGLCLRVGPREAAWYYMTRVDGRLIRLRLGSNGDLEAAGNPDRKASFTVAREKVGEVEQTVAAGKHPKAEQARERAALVEARAEDRERSVRNVTELWRARHWPTVSKSSQANYGKAADEFIEAFGDQDIGSIRRGQLIRHLEAVRLRSNTAANRAAIVVRQVFQYATDRFDLELNPAASLKGPVKPTRRKRTLDRAEIRVLWKACELAGYPYGHALRFALCTGQRIGEVGSMRRSDVDPSGDYWVQLDNKSDQRIDIYIGKHARAVLDDCPDFGKGQPFFSASMDANGDARVLRTDVWTNALVRYIGPKVEQAAKSLKVDPITKKWTPHDLRRTVRTALTGWCGVSPDTAERVLNHAIGGLRGVYDHADYRPHVREALSAWNTELGRILAGKEVDVVSIHRRARA